MTLFTALLEVAEAVTDGSFPMPVSLGVAGISLTALLSFFVWQNKMISSGKWVPGVQVEARLAEKDSAYDNMVVVKDAQHKTDVELVQEYRTTISTVQERATLLEGLLEKSIEANKLTDHFYTAFMPKRDSVGYDAAKEPDND